MGEEKNITQEKTKKSGFLKKFLKVLVYIVLGIIGLNVVLYILLSIPAVQNKVVNFALDKLRPIVKTEISIDKVRLTLFNHINLKGVYIESQTKDTLLYAGNLDVKVNLFRLLDNKLQINSVNLDDAVINVSQDTVGGDFNFQFLIDAFASTDTTAVDTATSTLEIAVSDIKIKNTRLNYDVWSEPVTPDTFNVSHISVSDLNSELSLESIDILSLDVTVKSLSFIEHSGFKVNNLEGVLLSQKGTLESKKITLILPDSDLDITDFSYNIFNKSVTAKINSGISPQDVSMFMPGLNELDNRITLTSDISGKLPAVSVNGLSLNYGDDMVLNASAELSDYEKYGESNLRLVIDKFRITPKAITQFARIGDPAFVAPDLLSTVEYIRLKGSVEGQLSHMDIDAEAWTNQGAIQLSGIASTDTTFEDFKIDASLNTQNFNLAPFVGSEMEIGRISLHSKVAIASINDLDARIEGAVDAIEYQKNTFKNIRFKGQYDPSRMSAWVNANLSIGKIDAEASMTQGRNGKINFDVDLDSLLVNFFYQNPAWENPKLSLRLKGDLTGSDIDNIEGTVDIDSLRFWGDNFNYQPGEIILQSGINEGKGRYINLTSSILKATITGEYNFTNLADEISNIMHQYLPGFFDENRRIRTYRNNFDVAVTINNTEAIGRIFQLPVTIIDPVTIIATINTIGQKLNLSADVPDLKYGETEIKSTKIGLYNSESSFNVNSSLRLPQENNSSIDANLDMAIKSDTINALLTVKNNGSDFKIDGQVNALAHFEQNRKELISSISFLPTDLNLGNLNFSILPANIVNRGNSTTISNFGIALNHKKYFGVDGVVSDQKGDSVRAYFDHAQIGDILSAFNINNIKGEANGQVVVTNTLDQPELYTRGLNLADIIIFGDSLGTLNLESHWDNRQKAATFNASLVNDISRSVVDGFVSTATDSLDVRLKLDRLSLGWLEPFMEGTLNHMSGSISSNIELRGSTNSPQADGWLGFNDMQIGVDYTNVTYRISDTIKVFPDKIGFRDLAIFDNNNNKAIASALVTHKNFQDLQYLLNLDLNNFLVLNTETRSDSLFYGKLLASGNIKVNGNADKIDVNMNIRNNKGSKINIVIPQVSEASTYESIVYINVPKEDSTAVINIPEKKTSSSLPLNLTMALTLNPDITLGVVIDPVTGDNLQMKGNATVNFSYNLETEEMKAYGDYILTDGSVRFRLQNIKTLNFKIKEGSKVTLPGDPMRATFDITAYDRVRANLSTLNTSFDNSRVYVDCLLGIKGNMQKMELTYDISLPDSNEDVQQKVRSIISTDDEKIRQFASLIATGSFYSGGSGSGNLGTSMWTNVASGAMSKVLDNLLGNILGSNFEIGTEISSEDGSFSDVDMRVNVSTRLFDDRLKLNTNLGYRTDQANTGDEFIGDFDMEYELTNTIKLTAFNRTNDRIYRQAAVTQGVGIVYTKEAQRIKDLFRSVRRKKKAEDNTSNKK